MVRIRRDRLALEDQFVDQGTNTHLVLSVGALKGRDFIVNHGFKFAGARDRTLNTIAHCCHFAANGLREADDGVDGGVCGLRKPKGYLRH